MGKRDKRMSCSDCGVLNCYRREKSFPDFCLTTNVPQKEIEKVNELYKNDSLVSKIAHTAAEIEGTYYGKLTRVEEIIAFAKRIGAKKIGIATCIGLMNEAKIFTKILKAKGLESYSVICKVGSIDKTEIGIAEEFKIQKGCHEALCNPILQARLLNREKTDLNVIVGLCVGHDSLFIKYSKAPVTTLITKDRVLGHNPAAALYTSGFYYKRLFDENDI
ncbi:putative metal-binding protein [Acetivibrio thermocellus AD2]|jgi:uncharacterized metal-binding protein|uniref:Metal-binding protein n=1 Tax=Acetivibrio thermocellus AD2 TaxID=1138384 RepID=A0AB36TCF7_ACETH|nr:DUF1847 domain-containing protein [Acetivibrio thermocellus]ADU73466.1 protein of unknown function DUF1847 [Acetivibrio thermocellus DSM 1313]ALX07388.1 protein of unknown function DUF1847 [Acetivibrio thermocellus AD2]ANV75127.1 protein of unknown function DUF1847 [Acetivibrio thermocellus DSM 2360]EIC04145.1 protein of unknown function DUF1847 [Acetivibrio thermocellus YS]NLU26043.1 DUF1847 domain-containing protein [Acetivibrio thermocellus]